MAVCVERRLHCRKDVQSHSSTAETSLECECTCSGQIAWATSLAEPVSGVKLSIPAEKPVPVGLLSEGQGRGRQSLGWGEES